MTQPTAQPVERRRIVLRSAAEFAFAVACAVAVGAAAAHEYYAAGFKIIHPWAPPSAPGASAAPVYMEFDEVSSADRLIAAHTDLAARVELRSAPDENTTDESSALPASSVPSAGTTPRAGIAPPAGIAIDPGGVTRLTPRGPHLVLVGLKDPLLWGRSYPLTLEFERAGAIETQLSVGAH